MTAKKALLAGIVAVLLCGLWSCAAGDPRFTPETPAGFWMGLWHGVISLVALVVGLFKDGVHVYEVRNTGAWYDLGFLLGVMGFSCGGIGSGSKVSGRGKCGKSDPEWDDIGRRVEKKVLRKLKEWSESEGDSDSDWKEIGEKAEAKLKRKIREWAEKE